MERYTTLGQDSNLSAMALVKGLNSKKLFYDPINVNQKKAKRPHKS